MDHRAAILCLTCNHSLDTEAPGQCPGCGRPYDPIDARSANASGRPIGWFARWCLRAPPWPAVAWVALLMLATFWDYASPRMAMRALSLQMDLCSNGPMFLVLLLSARVAQFVARAFFERRLNLPRSVLRSRHSFWPYLIGIVILSGYALQQNWPLKVGICLCAPAFDRVADAALADPDNAKKWTGQWVGLYYIRGVEVIGKTVVLYTNKHRGDYGFARVPSARADFIMNHPDHDEPCKEFPKQGNREGQGDPVGTRLEGDWFVMYSHFWFLKDVWSAAPAQTPVYANQLPTAQQFALRGRKICWCSRCVIVYNNRNG
jgi:hypothetical protein